MANLLNLRWSIIVIALLSWGGPVGAGNSPLVVGFSPNAAPWKMVTNGQADGAEARIIRAIADRLGLSPQFKTQPFTRNLISMQTGEIDIMTGLMRGPEREKYIHFIEPPYKTKSNKVFYVLKGKWPKISRYEDLAGLTIGANRSSKYFERFDTDPSLQVEYVPTVQQNIRKLLAGRIDTFIVTDSFGDYNIQRLGVADIIEKAPFAINQPIDVYIGISKKSHLMKRIENIESLLSQMIISGEIDQLICDFFKEKKLPLPDYR